MDAGLTIFSIAYVVILIVPGIIFKRFYFQGAFSRQFNSGLFADRLITSLFWGILVQIISLLSYSRIINIRYEEFKAKTLLIYKNILTNNLPDLSFSQLLNTLFYAIFSVFLAAMLGFLCYKLIRFFKLDLKLPAFRFANHWHYYFKGEILQTEEFGNSPRGKVISTEVDVMIRDENGKSNLFSGLLTQYTLNQQNELDTLYLTGSNRFSKSLGRTKNIPGDIFIIPYNTVQNLNVRYNFQVKQKKEIAKHVAIYLSAIILLTCLVTPWFLDITIWRKILGTFLFFVTWLFFTTILMSFFKPSNGATQLSASGRWISLSLFLLMLYLSNLVLHIVPLAW